MNGLYSRQSSLSLRRYNTAIVIGVGGIGNWVALDLALTGCIQNLYLIDPDTVEESNLNRTMFDYTDIGCYKVDAVSKQILLRRPDQNMYLMKTYMTDNLAKNIIEKVFNGDNSYYHSDIVICDCRDDIYEDCYQLNCKLYKVGYDGSEMTFDGNPRLTKVYGQRGGSYTVTPSYVCSSQLAAILLVNDILYPKVNKMLDSGKCNDEAILLTSMKSPDFPYLYNRCCYEYDEMGRLNDMVNISACDILHNFVEEKHEYVIPNEDYSNLPVKESESTDE